MNPRVRSNATKAAVDPILTTGAVFEDGAVIELVRSSTGRSKPDLLLWNGSVATIRPRVKHRGQLYEAVDIPSSIYHALLLPADSKQCEPRQLYREIAGLFSELNFADRESRLLASFCMVTWLADRLPIAPALQISGSDQMDGIELLRFLRSLCRHPLLLAEVTPGIFRSLPLHLSLTLLLNQVEIKPALARLLCASSYQGVHLAAGRGTVIDPYGPKAIFGGSEVGDLAYAGSIRIAIAPGQLHWTADQKVRAKIADHFQPRLLQFRLKNCSSWRRSSVDASTFTSDTRQLAGVLGACLSQDPEFAREIVDLLRPQDDQAREERLCTLEGAVIEVLWGLAHRGTDKQIAVAELADKANSLLRSRGECLIFSAEEVGWKLRTLGVRRRTSSAGKHVLFDRESRWRVHDLARLYGLPCAGNVVDGCPECAKPTDTT